MKSDLREAAARARLRAYAPYSGFLVGAALRLTSGAVVSGCNVENISFGLTMCAERVCVGKAIEQGEKGFEALAIVADTETPIVPCGACRQILWEFGGDLEVLLANLTDETGRHRLKDLLPLPFDARLL